MGSKLMVGVAAIAMLGALAGCSTGHQCGDLVCSGGETPESCAVDCLCGNGILDPGEECDGNLIGDTSCIEQGLQPGPVMCDVQCTLDYSQCGTSTCGNGTIEPGEQCEPGDLAGETCDSLGFSKGDLACTSDTCQFDYESCCNDQCADASDTQCSGDIVQNCVDSGIGCMVWEDGTDCEETGEFCEQDTDGAASCGCNDVCIEGSERCDSSLAQSCVVQPNGCADWETHTDCGGTTDACAVGPDGAVCVANASGENCTDPYPLTEGQNIVGWDATVKDFTASWPCGYAYAPDLVLEYTAATTGALEFTFHKPDSNTFVLNASAETCGTLTPSLECQSVYTGTEITGAFPISAGTTYYFYLGSSSSQAPSRPFVFDLAELDCSTSEVTPLNPLPADGGTSTSLRPELSIDFDGVVDTSQGVITLTGDMGTSLSFDLATSPTGISWSNNNKTLSISPGTAFPAGEHITVSWSGLLDDTCGNPVAQPSWAFDIIVPPCSPGTAGMVGTTVTKLASGFSISPYYLAADADWVYVGNTTALYRYDRTGGTNENLVTLASLSSSNLGYTMLVDGGDIYTVDEGTAQTGMVYRISTDGGSTWGATDYVSFPTTPNAAVRGVVAHDGKLWMITFSSTAPQIWSVPTGATTTPVTATLEGTVTGTGTCSGLAMDDDYFYTGCDGDNNVIRIDRTSYAGEILHDADEWDMSTTVNHVFADDTDDDGKADILYVKAWYERVHFVCSPGGATPYADTLVSDSTSSAYGGAFDVGGPTLFYYDSGTNEIVNID